MEKVRAYNFESGSKKTLRVYYGSAASIEENLTASTITLGNASPNPFSENTTVNVSLPAASETYNLELAIYNAFGQKVKTLAEGAYKGGFYEFNWNGFSNSGSKVPAGVYVYKLMVITDHMQKELSKKVIVK